MEKFQSTKGRRDRGRNYNKPWMPLPAFMDAARGSSEDLSLLVNGVMHARVVVWLQKKEGGAQGPILIEIDEGDRGMEASVIASGFERISPAPGGLPLAIPLRILFAEELDDATWAGLTEHESELRDALRWACNEARLAGLIAERWCEEVLSSSRKPGIAAHFVSLTALHLNQKIKFWGNVRHLSYLDRNGHVYFERRHVGNGIRALALIAADDEHPLAGLLHLHSEVEIEMCQIFDQAFIALPPKNAAVLHEARRAVARYVAGILPKIDFDHERRRSSAVMGK